MVARAVVTFRFCIFLYPEGQDGASRKGSRHGREGEACDPKVKIPPW